MKNLFRLPSGGDTSYAGMVLDEHDRLWVSYYSSHEGKTSVYLAQLKVTFHEPVRLRSSSISIAASFIPSCFSETRVTGDEPHDD